MPDSVTNTLALERDASRVSAVPVSAEPSSTKPLASCFAANAQGCETIVFLNQEADDIRSRDTLEHQGLGAVLATLNEDIKLTPKCLLPRWRGDAEHLA
jgi:hypothetical protein